MRRTKLAPLVAVSLVAACGEVSDPDNNFDNIHDAETISVPVTWEGTHLITGSLEVASRLTLAPCTEIQVEPDGWISVNDGGSIITQGTADCPVVFTSSKLAPGAGDWRGIDIYESASNDSMFEHTVIEYGGGSDGALWIDDGARVGLRNVLIRHTDDAGLDYALGGEISVFENVSFEDVGGHPIQAPAELVGQFTSVQSVGAGKNSILVRDILETDGTWKDHGIPYFIESLWIEATLTLEAGVEFLVAPDIDISVDNGGSLQFQGTVEAPVVVQSSKSGPAAGDWRGFEIWGTSGTSNLAFTVIRHGGGDGDGAIYLDGATLNLDHVSFEENLACDIEAYGTVNAEATEYVLCE